MHRAAEVRVLAAALGPRLQHTNASTANPSGPYYFTAYDVSNFDRNIVKFTIDWTPGPMWLVGFGATWRDTDYKDNYYGRINDHSQQYDGTVSWGDDKLRITGIGNWGKVKFEQDYRNTAPVATVPGSAAQRPDQQRQLQLGHAEHAGRLDGRGAGRLGAG